METLIVSFSTCELITVKGIASSSSALFFLGESSLTRHNHTLLSKNTASPLIGLVAVELVTLRSGPPELLHLLQKFGALVIVFRDHDGMSIRRRDIDVVALGEPDPNPSGDRPADHACLDRHPRRQRPGRRNRPARRADRRTGPTGHLSSVVPGGQRDRHRHRHRACAGGRR